MNYRNLSPEERFALEEPFENIETRVAHVYTLSDEERICLVCGTELVPIGT